MKNEIAFEMAASSIRFGPGVTREVGMDLADLGVRKVLVITDPVLARMAPVQTVLESLDSAGVAFMLYDRVRVEPTDESFLDAIAFAKHPALRCISSRLAADPPSTPRRPSTCTSHIRRPIFWTT